MSDVDVVYEGFCFKQGELRATKRMPWQCGNDTAAWSEAQT